MSTALDLPGRDPKRDATLKARCALCEVALYITEDDRGAPLYIATRWAMTRAMSSAVEVEAFIRRIGGPNA